MFVVPFTTLFNKTIYLFIAAPIASNVINSSIETHYFHTTPESCFTYCDIVFGTPRYDYHLVGLIKVEVLFCFLQQLLPDQGRHLPSLIYIFWCIHRGT